MTQPDNNFKNVPPPEQKVAGRPMTPLDENLIRAFLEEGMSVKRISDYFNCTPQTIYNRYGTLVHQMDVLFDFELLQKQRELALAGDRHMLIHLGKTRLKQSETAPVAAEPDVKDQGVTWEVDVMVVKKPDGLTDSEKAELEGLDTE